jgi:hypothetical protein
MNKSTRRAHAVNAPCCMPSPRLVSRRPLGFSYSWGRMAACYGQTGRSIGRSHTQAPCSLLRRSRRNRWTRNRL